MKTISREIWVMTAALMIFSLPTLADQGAIGQYAERGADAQIVDTGTINHGGNGGFSCYPFICG